MTNANISKPKIVAEYVDAGKFDVTSFNKETGKRLGTYSGLDVHKALAEFLKLSPCRVDVLILQWPEEMTYSERREAEETYQSALPYIAKFSVDR